MKSKQTKATDISQAVKKIVWERDKHRCVVCSSPESFPEAHVISRAHGGLGIEQNIVTLCRKCHFEFDNGNDREYYLRRIETYLKARYTNWNREMLVFRKGIH